MIIVLEGINGSGKSTQTSLLERHLKSKGTDIHVLREPGSTPIGEKIRELLLHKYQGEEENIHTYAQVGLFLSARAQLYHTKMIPILDRGGTIILDRWIDSTIAYQGFCLNGPSGEDILQLADILLLGCRPDATIILDVPVQLADDRRKGKPGDRTDRFEAKGLDFQQRLRIAYQSIAMTLPRHALVNGTGSIEVIHQRVLTAIQQVTHEIK